MAADLARRAHEGQRRKYNGDPYIYHPARVAGRVGLLKYATEEMVAAAYLHDVLEDTDVRPAVIEQTFGSEVLKLVLGLTNPSKGSKAPRPERKMMDRQWLSAQSTQVKLIKLLDRIDNLREMSGAEDSFRKVYASESLLLASAIGDADAELREELERLARAL